MVWYIWAILLTALSSLTVVTVDIVRRILLLRIEGKGCPYPPGPTSLPLIGGALSVSTLLPWVTYTEWRAKYGEYRARWECGMLTRSAPRRYNIRSIFGYRRYCPELHLHRH